MVSQLRNLQFLEHRSNCVKKCQQVVRSIGYAGGASGCSGLARSLFTFSKHFKNDTCSGGPS
jgi:hypothetical protein